MEQFRLLVRMGLMSLPLLTSACASGNGLALEPNDPSCVLLCALTRSISGESPKPLPVPEKSAVAPVSHRSRGHQPSNRSILKRPHRGSVGAARVPKPIRTRGVRAPKTTESVEPVTAVPRADPAPMNPPSTRAAPTIPGSAAIMPSTIQGR